MPRPYVPNAGARIAIIVALVLGGFVFPLLWIAAAVVAFALVQEFREPADPTDHAEYYRRFAKPDESDWQHYWRVRCESPAEEAFLEAALNSWRLQPRRGVLRAGDRALQMQVAIASYRVDFLLNDKLVIEIDGAAYHSEPEDVARDAARDAHLRELGYRVVRIPAKVVFNDPDQAIRRVEAALLAVPAAQPAKPVNVVRQAVGVVASVGNAMDELSRRAVAYQPPPKPEPINDVLFHRILRERVSARMTIFRESLLPTLAVVQGPLEAMHKESVEREEEEILRKEWALRDQGLGPESQASRNAAQSRRDSDLAHYPPHGKSRTGFPEDDFVEDQDIPF